MAEEGLEIDRRFRGGKIDVKKFAPRRLRPRLCSVFVLLHSILFMPSFKDFQSFLGHGVPDAVASSDLKVPKLP